MLSWNRSWQKFQSWSFKVSGLLFTRVNNICVLHFMDSIFFSHRQTLETVCLFLGLISRQDPHSCLYTSLFRLNEKINELGWIWDTQTQIYTQTKAFSSSCYSYFSFSNLFSSSFRHLYGLLVLGILKIHYSDQSIHMRKFKLLWTFWL